jgi:hypothetical protein
MKGYVRELAEVDCLYFDSRSTLIHVVLDERASRYLLKPFSLGHKNIDANFLSLQSFGLSHHAHLIFISTL